MIKELQEIIDYIEDFLNNKPSFEEAWFASFDLQDFIKERSGIILANDEKLMEILETDVRDICEALDYVKEDVSIYCISEKTFRRKLAEALIKLKESNMQQ